MAVTTTYLKSLGDALANVNQGKYGLIKFTIDTATTNVADGEVVKLMLIPSETKIVNVAASVTTAEGATLTCDVGDYTTATDAAVDADGYLDGFNGNSVAVTATVDQLKEDTTTLGYASGKLYTASGSYLGVLFNDAADAAIIDIFVEVVDYR